jgi:hypothetical protein
MLPIAIKTATAAGIIFFTATLFWKQVADTGWNGTASGSGIGLSSIDAI